MRALRARGDVRALAHVTGGGIAGNLARVLPDGLGAVVDPASWQRPAVFGWLAEMGVPEDELRRVFNIGIGYCAVIPPADVGGDDLVIGRSSRRTGVAWRVSAGVGVLVSGEGTNLQALIDAAYRSRPWRRTWRAPGARARHRSRAPRQRCSRSTTTPTATRATRRWPTGSRRTVSRLVVCAGYMHLLRPVFLAASR